MYVHKETDFLNALMMVFNVKDEINEDLTTIY